jgi:hypothetical protein
MGGILSAVKSIDKDEGGRVQLPIVGANRALAKRFMKQRSEMKLAPFGMK